MSIATGEARGGGSALGSEAAVGQVISEGGGPSLNGVQFRLHHDQNTTVGHVLGIRGNRPKSGQHILTLIRVEGLREHNPHEDAQSSTVSAVIPFETRYAPEGRSTVIYRVAEAELLEEVLLDGAGKLVSIEAATTLPRAGSVVVEVAPELIAQALNFAEPEVGLEMGAIHGSNNVAACLKREIIQTHVFFAGGIGRGKSYARGVLAEELAAHGIPQINIDPMGEMVDATSALGGINLKPGQGFSLPLSALQSSDVVDAIPAINAGTNIETLVRYAHETLLRDKVLTKGEYFGVDDLVKRIEEIAPDLDMAKAGTLRPAILRARSLERIDFIGKPFPWETEIRPGRMLNIDCRGRLVTDLRLIVASVARDLQRLANAKKIPFVAFSIDEAHLVCPNDDRNITTQVLREIARIGRHYRLGLILTTQSPGDMDRSILKRLLTRFIFAVESDQLDSLRGVFADTPPGMIKQLAKLPVGTCLVTGVSETIKHATLVDIRKRRTPVGGATPDIFNDLSVRGWPAKRELSQLVKKAP